LKRIEAVVDNSKTNHPEKEKYESAILYCMFRKKILIKMPETRNEGRGALVILLNFYHVS